MFIDDVNLNLYAKALCKHKPEWLFGGASIWYILASYMKKNSISPPRTIKFLETSGEFLNKKIGDFLSEFFQCKVIDMYGCIETYDIARTSKYCDKLQILEDNVIVEIVDAKGHEINDGEYGQIAITALNNNAMPLIRYAIGDVGKKCVTVNNMDSITKKNLELKSTRINETISVKDSQPIDSFVFHCAIERINRSSDISILQFKVIQEDYDLFKIYINMDNTLNKTCSELEEKLHYELSFYKLGHAKLIIYLVEKIDINMLTGKFQYFVNNVVE